MKKYILPLILLSAMGVRAQLVFDNGGYLVMNGGASGTPIYTVLGGTAIPATPIVVNTSGGIIAENEYHKLRYNLGTNTTAINVPFLRGASLTNKTGVALTAITAGAGAGYFDFSNVAAPVTSTGWDNNTYRPSMVVHMSQNTAPGTNGSDYAIDRFWLIDPQSYTTKPTATLTFNYLADELAANGSNTINENNLTAQRFNTTGSIWGDFVSGTVNTVSKTVSTVVVPANFFTAWTLTDKTNPLPIELKSINAMCTTTNEAIVKWTTATETNNNYFTLEKSNNGLTFETVVKIAGAGNSITDKHYTYTDKNVENSTTYYRLKQTDFDGVFKYSTVFTVNCGTNSSTVFNYSKAYTIDSYNINLEVNASQNETRIINVTNTLGQILQSMPYEFSSGYNLIKLPTTYLASGMYFVSITNNEQMLTKKIIVTK
jgi:hypothetical protein